jgi:phage gpG-like protein
MADLRRAECVTLIGLKEAQRQIRELPAEIRKLAYPVLRQAALGAMREARAKVPVREPGQVPGYTGGALRKHIKGRASAKTLQGFVGIERGAAITLPGRQAQYAKAHTASPQYYGKDGKLHRRRYKRVLSAESHKMIAAQGGRVIMPTKYGHLVEYGTASRVSKTGRPAGQMPARPFMHLAIKGQQASFEAGMRAIAPDLIRALEQLGSKPATGGA